MTSLLATFLIIAIFFSLTLEAQTNQRWSLRFLLELIFSRFWIFAKIGQAFKLVDSRKLFSTQNSQGKKIAKRIALGLLLFLLVAFSLIIPLLSSADPVFAQKFSKILDWVGEIFSWKYFDRLLFFIFASLGLMAFYLSLEKKNKDHDSAKPEAEPKKEIFDPIISGIVLGGVLLLYLLFIWVQLETLWVDFLPVKFEETESLVKSGFWQLLFLSIINIIFYFIYYGRVNRFVSQILRAFFMASFLILVSAGQRMFLYVLNYGFSYEKFFASYTVLYCAILFLWLIFQLFRKKSADILRFSVLLLLWMYAILTVLPVENWIFSANVKLSQRPDSRINLYELKMLSADVLPNVAEYRSDEEWKKAWCGWAKVRVAENENKKWFERNLKSLSQSWEEKIKRDWDLENRKEKFELPKDQAGTSDCDSRWEVR